MADLLGAPGPPRPIGDLRGPRDLMDLLAAVEATIPVDEWRVGDLDVWPLVRVRLAHRLARTLDWRPARNSSIGPASVARRAGAAARGLVTHGRRPSKPEAGAASGRVRSDVVVCSDGVSFAPTSDGFQDRHADPLRRGLDDHGLSSTLLVPGRRAPARLTSSHRRIQPALDLALAAARFRASPPAELPGYDDLLGELDRQGVADHLPDRRTIAYAAAGVEAMAKVFTREIERVAARLGVVVEYYALHGLAFVLACQQSGIPAVDLQHGVQGRLHYAYAAWRRLPVDGSLLLPDRFWVWGEDEAATIADWAVEGRARAIVGGNLERNEWSAGTAPGAAEATRVIDAMTAGRPRSALVLVATAGEEPDEAIDAILDVVGAGPSDWLWCIRCHPTDPSWARWARRAAAAGIDNVEVRHSTELPLFALLGRVDAVVTRYSSVVLDALSFGVRSVLTDPQGADLYAGAIESGDALVAGSSPADVVAAVTTAMEPPRGPVDGPDADAAFGELIGSTR